MVFTRGTGVMGMLRVTSVPPVTFWPRPKDGDNGDWLRSTENYVKKNPTGTPNTPHNTPPAPNTHYQSQKSVWWSDALLSNFAGSEMGWGR